MSRDDMDDSDIYDLNPYNEEDYVLPDEDDKGIRIIFCYFN